MIWVTAGSILICLISMTFVVVCYRDVLVNRRIAVEGLKTLLRYSPNRAFKLLTMYKEAPLTKTLGGLMRLLYKESVELRDITSTTEEPTE